MSVMLDCPTVSSKEFIVSDDDNVYIILITAEKDIFEFVQSSKNIIDAYSDDVTEMSKAAYVPIHLNLGTSRQICAVI
ncbi:hypothetical protein TNCV_4732151 [Trichonephila clavipes]|nr:hypothetical protein TNCV_4732151 [Trichonephila clavipes]